MSTEVADLLKELTSAGKRHGGLHAASGTLRGELGDNVRLSVLNIIFKSVGLPPKYPVARFVMWLRDNDKLDAVKGRVTKAGRDFTKELNNLWVSPVLHKALVDEGLGASASDISKSLAQQFPNVKDITIDDTLQAIREAPIRNVGVNESQPPTASEPPKREAVSPSTVPPPPAAPSTPPKVPEAAPAPKAAVSPPPGPASITFDVSGPVHVARCPNRS